MNFLFAFGVTFILCWVSVPILLVFLGAINFYTTVMEGRAKVYVLFGRVLGVVSEPGLHFLWLQLGPQATLVRFFGQVQGKWLKDWKSGVDLLRIIHLKTARRKNWGRNASTGC